MDPYKTLGCSLLRVVSQDLRKIVLHLPGLFLGLLDRHSVLYLIPSYSSTFIFYIDLPTREGTTPGVSKGYCDDTYQTPVHSHLPTNPPTHFSPCHFGPVTGSPDPSPSRVHPLTPLRLTSSKNVRSLHPAQTYDRDQAHRRFPVPLRLSRPLQLSRPRFLLVHP